MLETYLNSLINDNGNEPYHFLFWYLSIATVLGTAVIQHYKLLYKLVVSFGEKGFFWFAFETTVIAIDRVKVYIVRSLKSGNEAVTLTIVSLAYLYTNSVFYLPLVI